MKLTGRKRRHQRIRKKVVGTKERPRLYIFRSNKHIYAQLIDDTQQKVICGVGSPGDKAIAKEKKIAAAHEIGKKIGKIAIEKGVEKVAFDRGGYKYHGRVKAIAEGAREAGLKF
jgi:large subunit ribosomal protein L18